MGPRPDIKVMGWMQTCILGPVTQRAKLLQLWHRPTRTMTPLGWKWKRVGSGTKPWLFWSKSILIRWIPGATQLFGNPFSSPQLQMSSPSMCECFLPACCGLFSSLVKVLSTRVYGCSHPSQNPWLGFKKKRTTFTLNSDKFYQFESNGTSTNKLFETKGGTRRWVSFGSSGEERKRIRVYEFETLYNLYPDPEM